MLKVNDTVQLSGADVPGALWCVPHTVVQQCVVWCASGTHIQEAVTGRGDGTSKSAGHGLGRL